MTIFLIGMCYAGKTTIGNLLSQKLEKSWLDSRDIFKNLYRISENEYLKLHGQQQFQKAEEISISQDFGDIVVSLGGSAIYYPKQMQHIFNNHTIIWLNAPLEVIEYRKSEENQQRPIVYPDNINSFTELYNQRYSLYKQYHTLEIPIFQNDIPDDIVNRILHNLEY
jgi:shikimate kinase